MRGSGLALHQGMELVRFCFLGFAQVGVVRCFCVVCDIGSLSDSRLEVRCVLMDVNSHD